MRMRRQIALALLFSTFLLWSAGQVTFCQTNFWQQTNGPTLGEIYGLTIDSSDRIYAGFEGGIAYSTDSGHSWTRLKTVLDSSKVTVLVAKSNNLIFAGTWGQGVFRSTNGGLNWVHVGNFISESISELVITPVGGLIATTFSGVYLSSDDGEKWSKIFNETNAVAVDSGGRIFVATNYYSDRSGTFGGVYRSSNSGISWEQVNAGLPVPSVRPHALLVGRGSTVYLGLEAGLYRSTDGGTTWSRVSTADVTVFGLKRNGCLFAGTDFIGGLYRSQDTGSTWQTNGVGIRNFKISSFAETSNGDFLAATNGGIYKTTNNGDTWLKVNSGFTFASTSHIAVHPVSSIWAVAHSSSPSDNASGIYVSTNNGVDWIEKSFGSHELYYGQITIDREGTVYVGTDQGVFATNDFGQRWAQRNNGLDYFDTRRIVAGNQHYIYLCAQAGGSRDDPKSMYRTTDQGLHWSKANEGLPPTSTADWFAFDSDDNLYATFSFAGVYRTTDHGDSWTPINKGLLDSTTVGPIAVNSSNELFAYNYPYGVFKSTDRGSSWVFQGNSGWSNSPVYTLTFARHNNLYAGGQSGVSLSTDAGTNWVSFNSGLGSQIVSSLAFDNVGYLLAGTYSNGIYRSTSPVVSVQREVVRITAFPIEQNYPNPFNPTTTIQYSVPSTQYVSLKIYDVLGREVALLVDETMQPGTYTVTWDAHGFSSGVYFYRLSAGGPSASSGQSFAETKRMMLLR